MVSVIPLLKNALDELGLQSSDKEFVKVCIEQVIEEIKELECIKNKEQK